MAQLLVELDQRDTAEGTLNHLRLQHPHLPPEMQRHGVQFLHVGQGSMPPPTSLDGYVFGVLNFAMRHQASIRVKGPVSARAIRNARIFQEAWLCWRPDIYSPVDIIPDSIITADSTPRTVPDRAIAAFSGGVDATFLALRHGQRLLGNASFALRDVAMVHGFDVRLENTVAFDRLRRRTEPLLDALGLRLHIVRTDLRHDDVQDWEHSFAPQLSSVLHQFSGEFAYGLIGSSEPYSHMVNEWGSTPATDYLLSGAGFDIVHEGAGYSRTAKVALINDHALARRTLKVCWAGQAQDRNCGRCEKCVRTQLNFAAVGEMHPPCFDTPFDPAMIDSLTVTSPPQMTELETIIAYARTHHATAAWVDRLAARIRVLRRRQIRPESYLRARILAPLRKIRHVLHPKPRISA